MVAIRNITIVRVGLYKPKPWRWSHNAGCATQSRGGGIGDRDLTTNTQVQFEAARAFSHGNSFALILDKPLLELRNGRRAAGVEHEKIT